MRYFIMFVLVLMAWNKIESMGCHAYEPLTNAEAGYNQEAYDECMDSAEDLDCDDIE
jgi:hypothetical protein